jgi:arylsulfatase A-like enzyme
MRPTPFTVVSVAGTCAATALLIFGLACGSKEASPAPVGTGVTPPGEAPSGGPSGGPAPAAARADQTRLFDLVDNRLLAHQQRGGGLVITPGTGGFAKYTRFGRPKLTWKLDQKKDGKRVGVADKYASFDVPLTAAQAAAGSKITLRLHTDGPLQLEIKLNGKTSTIDVPGSGWQTISGALEGAQAGDNQIQMVSTKGGPTVEWIQLGGNATGDDAPPLYDPAQKALVLPEGGGVAYYLLAPEKARLDGMVGGQGCTVEARVALEADALGGKASVTGNLAQGVDLAPFAGQLVRVDLTAKGCPKALVSDAGLFLAGKPPAAKKAPKPKYVVFWVMDSLRADRVKPFNPKTRNETPVFESLARRGAVFMQNYVQGNESRASHASMWTATYTGTHRYIPGGEKGVKASFVTIDEVMKGAGFYTSGVTSNGYITAKNGFGNQWDAYRNHIHDGGGVSGEQIFKYAIQSIEKKKGTPWFLYIGTIDTHVSWRAKEPWISRYDPGYTGKYAKEASGKDVEAMATGKLKVTDREKQHIVAIYDSNVSYQDELLGQLLKKLDEWGIADETMIIVTADHGDEQWEDGRVGHGASTRESLVHVPLLVVYPPLIPAGLVVEGAETIDVLPTIIDALGMQAPETMMGMSLVPITQGIGKGYPRPSITSMYEGAWAMRIGKWKLRVPGNGQATLFDLSEDYYEKKDLAGTRHFARRYLADAMSTFLMHQKAWRKELYGLANNMTAKAAAAWD